MIPTDPIKLEEALERIRKQKQEKAIEQAKREAYMKDHVKKITKPISRSLERWLKQHGMNRWDIKSHMVTGRKYIEICHERDFSDCERIYLPDKFQT